MPAFLAKVSDCHPLLLEDFLELLRKIIYRVFIVFQSWHALITKDELSRSSENELRVYEKKSEYIFKIPMYHRLVISFSIVFQKI